MANTYTRIHIHVVFAVQGRINLIHKDYQDQLEKYISGIIRNKNQKLIAIKCMPDHAHIFIGLRPDMALSDLVRDIKNNATRFINEQRWIKGRFNWQEGFGAFSYSRSQIDSVVKYITNQDAHHKQTSFLEEYENMLKKFNIEYDKRYVFDDV